MNPVSMAVAKAVKPIDTAASLLLSSPSSSSSLVGSDKASPISILASPISCNRSLQLFSSVRRSIRRIEDLTAPGSAFQSGSFAMAAAIMSVTVGPAQVGLTRKHLVQDTSKGPNVGPLVDFLPPRLLR